MEKTLRERLRRYEGQPIRIFTDDRRVFTGIELEVEGDTVRCIDECGRLFFFELCHIDSIEEPQMELRRCHKCKREEFDGREDRDRDRDFNCGCGRAGCCCGR